MHDPYTQIIHIPFIGILWHKDPEADGTDDSCSWSGLKVNPEFAEWLRKEGRSEYKFYFGADYATMRDASTFEVVHSVWSQITWRWKKLYRQPFGRWRHARRLRSDLYEIVTISSGAGDNFNWAVSRAREDEDGMAELFYLVGRVINRAHRPWYKHPKFHFWHWRLTPAISMWWRGRRARAQMPAASEVRDA